MKKKDVNLEDCIADYQRLIQLNNHVDSLFKKKSKEISESPKKNN